MLIRLLGLAVLLFPASPVGLFAQQSSEVFEEIIDVSVVNVEVVVVDRKGRPVDGLGQEDFRILVDGQEQELTNFFAAHGTSPSNSLGADTWVTGPEARPANSTKRLTVIVFVDNLGIRPENRKALFDRLRSHLRQIDTSAELARHSGTDSFEPQLMVVSHGPGTEIVEPLTSDLDRIGGALQRLEARSTLFAALDGSRKMFMSRLGHASLRRYQPPRGSSTDPEFDDAIRVALELGLSVRTLAEERYQTVEKSFDALAHLCDALGGLPGRKALLYLSDGLPLRPADSLLDAWTGKYQNWIFQNQNDMRLRSRFPDAPSRFRTLMNSIGSSEFDLQDRLDRMVTRAAGAGVVFYPVSAGGRGSALMSADVSGAGMHGDVGAGSMHRSATTTENMTRDATLLRMAEDSGGEALLGTTALEGFLDRLARDFSSYYSLGIAPPTGEDGLLHDLEVEVLHPGLSVRHAKGYVAKNWRQRLGENAAAAAVYGYERNPLGVEVDPGVESRDGKRFLVPLMIKIPFERIKLVHRDSHFNAQLTVLVLVGDQTGGLSRTHRVDIPIKIPDSRVLEAIEQKAAYPLDLRMEGGRKRIAIGVRDHLAETEAAITLDIDVGRGVQNGS
jgi:VWFA-related protein